MLTSEIIAHNLYGMIDTFTTVKLNDTTKVLIPRTGVNTSYQRAVIIDQLYNIVLCSGENTRRVLSWELSDSRNHGFVIIQRNWKLCFELKSIDRPMLKSIYLDTVLR